MKIEITDHRKVFTIQREFNELLPNLKLEFFAKPHTSDGKHSDRIVKHPSSSVGTCRTIHTKGTIEIIPSLTVRELEGIFRDVYGLAVRVLRKSGSNWIETKGSDGLSLEEQNKKGSEILTGEHESVQN